MLETCEVWHAHVPTLQTRTFPRLSRFVVVAGHAALPFHLSHAVLQVMLLKVLHVHSRHENRCVREQVVHLFKRAFGSLGLDGPEEQRVREVANNLIDTLACE